MSDQILTWRDEAKAIVTLWASCEMLGIPEGHIFQPGHGFGSAEPRLKAPSTLLLEGHLPEKMWRPFAITKGERKRTTANPF